MKKRGGDGGLKMKEKRCRRTGGDERIRMKMSLMMGNKKKQ